MIAGRTPLWRLLATGAGAGSLLVATGPLNDADVYWHVRLGERILDTHRIPTREPWDFPALGRHWVPHSWLSEVVLALAHRAAGWNGVVVLRLVLGVALLAMLARAVLRGTDAVAGPLVFAVAALALVPSFSERPQLFALVLLAALLPLLDRARAGAAPHLLVAAGLGWLWASLHGSWPLLPAAFVLAAACALVSSRPARRAEARRLGLAALATVAGAAVTPVGPALLLRPFVVARATQGLSEWHAVRLASTFGVAYGLLLAALAFAWARAGRVPAADLLWAGAIAVAGLTAWRNLSFATVLLAPDVARHVSAIVRRGPRTEVPRWALAAFGGACALALVALTAASPTFADDAPLRLLARLRAEPGQVRVLDDYNLGGLVTGLGGPHVSAAIDGRVDAFPSGYLGRYLSAMDLQGDWPGLLTRLHPTHALLASQAPLAYVLETDRGWRRLGTEGTWVLLAAP